MNDQFEEQLKEKYSFKANNQFNTKKNQNFSNNNQIDDQKNIIVKFPNRNQASETFFDNKMINKNCLIKHNHKQNSINISEQYEKRMKNIQNSQKSSKKTSLNSEIIEIESHTPNINLNIKLKQEDDSVKSSYSKQKEESIKSSQFDANLNNNINSLNNSKIDNVNEIFNDKSSIGQVNSDLFNSNDKVIEQQYNDNDNIKQIQSNSYSIEIKQEQYHTSKDQSLNSTNCFIEQLDQIVNNSDIIEKTINNQSISEIGNSQYNDEYKDNKYELSELKELQQNLLNDQNKIKNENSILKDTNSKMEQSLKDQNKLKVDQDNVLTEFKDKLNYIDVIESKLKKYNDLSIEEENEINFDKINSPKQQEIKANESSQSKNKFSKEPELNALIPQSQSNESIEISSADQFLFNQIGKKNQNKHIIPQQIQGKITMAGCGYQQTAFLTIDCKLLTYGKQMNDNSKMVNFPNPTHLVNSISCGSEHLIVLTVKNEIQGQGRNRQGECDIDQNNSSNRKYKIIKIFAGQYNTILINSQNLLFQYGQDMNSVMRPNESLQGKITDVSIFMHNIYINTSQVDQVKRYVVTGANSNKYNRYIEYFKDQFKSIQIGLNWFAILTKYGQIIIIDNEEFNDKFNHVYSKFIFDKDNNHLTAQLIDGSFETTKNIHFSDCDEVHIGQDHSIELQKLKKVQIDQESIDSYKKLQYQKFIKFEDIDLTNKFHI